MMLSTNSVTLLVLFSLLTTIPMFWLATIFMHRGQFSAGNYAAALGSLSFGLAVGGCFELVLRSPDCIPVVGSAIIELPAACKPQKLGTTATSYGTYRSEYALNSGALVVAEDGLILQVIEI